MKSSAVKSALWLLLVLQCVAAFYVMSPWQPNADSADYLQLAEALRNGAYGTQTAAGFEPEALRPPAYPHFLHLMLHVLGLPLAAVIILQLGMYLGSVYLVCRILERRSITPIPFLFLSTGYIFAAIYSSAILAEAPAMLTVTAVAALLDDGTAGLGRLAAIGAICGVAALARPDLLLLPVAAAAAVVLSAFSMQGLLRRAGRAAVPVLVAGTVLLPYSIWNYANFGRFSPAPVAGAVGTSLYLSTWQGKIPLDDLNALYAGRVTERVRESGLEAEIIELNGRIGAPPLTAPWTPQSYGTRELQIRATRILGEAAARRIAADPAMYARHVLQNVWTLWNTSAYPASTPYPAELALRLLSALVTVAGLAGAALSVFRPRGWPLPLGAAFVLLYLPAIHLWLHTEARYTAPVRPLLVMFAAVFLMWLWTRFGPRTLTGLKLDRPSPTA